MLRMLLLTQGDPETTNPESLNPEAKKLKRPRHPEILKAVEPEELQKAQSPNPLLVNPHQGPDFTRQDPWMAHVM